MARAIFSVAPGLLLGFYLRFGTVYCYLKGSAAWRYGAIERKEEPIAFLSLLIILGAGGLFFIAVALYSLAHWPKP